jgi:hypothetical protein
MAEFTRGNKMVFPESGGNNYPESRENEIVSRTERMMFHDTGINNPASQYGGGGRNSFGAMCGYGPKAVQESYRSGLSRSKAGHDGVLDR